ncbi:MAG: ParB N-terminal domain-containing protein [Candidatus Riflebacteria bacterium]|nr:ParB N-terminal domain-containing protein [Candidatus Riflebacteria bacterium]
MNREIIIDPEFQNHVASLQEHEMRLLENSIRAEGCREKLIVWDDGERLLLVDGHHRLAICNNLGLKYDFEIRNFSDRATVIDFIERNQLGRRNLNNLQTSYYIGCRYNREKNDHGGNRKASGEDFHLKTSEIIGVELGINERTVRAHGVFATSVDQLVTYLGSSAIDGFATKALLLKSNLSIKDINAMAKSKLDKSEIRKAISKINNGEYNNFFDYQEPLFRLKTDNQGMIPDRVEKTENEKIDTEQVKKTATEGINGSNTIEASIQSENEKSEQTVHEIQPEQNTCSVFRFMLEIDSSFEKEIYLCPENPNAKKKYGVVGWRFRGNPFFEKIKVILNDSFKIFKEKP